MLPFRDDIPARRYPLMTLTIILANVVVFLYQVSLSQRGGLPEFLALYAIVPANFRLAAQYPVEATTGLGLSVLTSMFLHGGWIHLIGNMWYLWIFGDNVEDRMGHFRFLLFYLLCGSLAGFAHILFNLDSRIPSLGASGAVAGVLGAYLVSYPFARVSTLLPFFLFWPIVRLPAVLVLGSWFFVQLLNETAAVVETSQTMGGVAWWAHIGGFVVGMLLIGIFSHAPVRRYRW